MTDMPKGVPMPAVVCVIGKKKSGKTATVIGLVRELAARGLRVMTAKHGHHFELDVEGKDSWRHRAEAGAERVVAAGPDELAVIGSWPGGRERTVEELALRYLADADIVVAEGFKTSSVPKIEVFRRAAAHADAIYGSVPAIDDTYLAVLTDVPGFTAHVPVMDIDDPRRFARLADLVEAHVLGRRPSLPRDPEPVPEAGAP